MTAQDIEIQVAKYFDYRLNIIVPNVSWGLFKYECDMIVLTPAGYAYEIEIKVSKADIKADLKKEHQHINSVIKSLYFAVPDELKDDENIPANAGILAIKKEEKKFFDGNNWTYNTYWYCKKFRNPKLRSAVKWSEEKRYQLARLGTMRIWTLKETIRNLSRYNIELNKDLYKYEREAEEKAEVKS